MKETKKKPVKKTKINLNELIIDNADKEQKELERCRKQAEKAEREERKRILGVLKFFVETWDRVNPTDWNDDLNKPIGLDEWLKSRYDINDFCNLPNELIDLKEEYVSLKEPDLREWTLYKFIICYKEFLIKELKNIIEYESQNKCGYVKDKIKLTGLGTTEYYCSNETFDNFVDIALDEDLHYDCKAEFKEDLLMMYDDEDVDYLRPKYLVKKKKWSF